MPEFGFPAQFRQAAMRSVISSMRDQADDARFAAVTERYADVTSELDGRVNELMQIEKSINDLRAYSEVIAVSEARSRTMQDSLDNVRTMAQDVADTSLKLQTNATDSDLETLSHQAREALDSMLGQLNVSFGGRALFAADDADNAAVTDMGQILAESVAFLEGGVTSSDAYAALEAEFMDPGGLFDTNWYLGGTGNAPRAEVGPGEVVDFTVRANEDGVRRALFNTAVMAQAFDLSNNIPTFQRRELIEQASLGLREAISDVTAIQSRLGTAEARIATVKARNIASDASLTLSFNDLAGADAYDAAIQLTQLESQLEVAFATTSRLANLSLANFR